MKVCVTGGAGFIGSNLVDRLAAAGHQVTVLDDLSTGSRENLGRSPSVTLIQDDVREGAAVRRAVQGAEVVFHQAALASVQRSLEDPVVVNDVNLGGTLRVLVEARDAGVRRVVLASSSSVYGDAPELPKREDALPDPRSPYAASKTAAEAYLFAFQASYGLTGVALRYFNVYGERQRADSPYAAVVPRFLAAMVRGEPPVLFGDGLQTRDFTYVGDVVEALLGAAAAPAAATGRPINVGGGREVSVRDLCAEIAAVVGFRGSPIHEPARAGEVRRSRADISRARDLLGWRPRTSLAEGIRRLAVAAGIPRQG